MIAWQPFTHNGQVYDLAHLHPRRTTIVQEAQPGKPARSYTLQVIFSLHCFTRGIASGEQPESALLYSDARETRVFDFARYELSKLLPAIIEQLPARKCYHSGKGNFFIVELVDQNGSRDEYEIFFTASRSTTRGVLNLFVQSAYIRDEHHMQGKPAPRKPIRIEILLFNIQANKPIRMP